ncbi:pantoate--beta-alanine ligase [bacterium]|nr:pantoate--beta-alanine ligase [bacterium]
MIRLQTATEMREWSQLQHASGKRIGFVPTMGFLHEGHLTLVDIAAEQSDLVVVSIFVNPTQFGPNEDFDKYPRDMEGDLAKLEARGVVAVYLPEISSMYPDGYATYVAVERLGDHLCGASRPNHFRGVTTVVTKLFHAVHPDVAVFGQKDAQQAAIIKRMTIDLDFGTEIILGPILREKDGLAMSSRNVRLSDVHRAQAPALQRGLKSAWKLYNAGVRSATDLKREVETTLKQDAPDGRVDYIEIVDLDQLQPVATIDVPALLAIAVFFGDVRLIDNVELV